MKILLALDGSQYSMMSVKMLKALKLPSTSEVLVMSVVPEHVFWGGITIDALRGTSSASSQARKAEEQKAAAILTEPVETLRASGLKVETLVSRGKPAEQIINRAGEAKADLIVIGARGISDSQRFPLGGVAQEVMRHAVCSVLLVKEGPSAIRETFLATDGSSYSEESVDFLLDLPLPKQSQVTIVTALESHVPEHMKGRTLNLEQPVLKKLQEREEVGARSLMGKLKEQFEAGGYQASLWILRGEPAEAILVAANEVNPELIALGAKGLSGADTFLLGSVAQRVARFSRYSVLIVRPSKT